MVVFRANDVIFLSNDVTETCVREVGYVHVVCVTRAPAELAFDVLTVEEMAEDHLVANQNLKKKKQK